MACEPSEDSDQPGHLPSLIRVLAVHMKNAQADLSLPSAHSHFGGFVMRWQLTLAPFGIRGYAHNCCK